MVALWIIFSCITVLAAAFTIVVRQMAHAHRQQFDDEVAANNFACTRHYEIEHKARRKARWSRMPRRPASRAPADHSHSGLTM